MSKSAPSLLVRNALWKLKCRTVWEPWLYTINWHQPGLEEFESICSDAYFEKPRNICTNTSKCAAVSLNVEPLLRINWPGMPQERLVRKVLLATHTGKRPRGCPRTRWRDYIYGLAWFHVGAEPAELSEIAESHEVFRGLQPPRPSPEQKWVWKWANEYKHFDREQLVTDTFTAFLRFTLQYVKNQAQDRSTSRKSRSKENSIINGYVESWFNNRPAKSSQFIVFWKKLHYFVKRRHEAHSQLVCFISDGQECNSQVKHNTQRHWEKILNNKIIEWTTRQWRCRVGNGSLLGRISPDC